MATQEQGDIVVTDNTNATITSTIYGPGSGSERENYGTVRTTISSNTVGETTTFRMSTADSSYPPDDTSDNLVKLVEFAGDMIAHWTAVQTKLVEIAGSDGED